jgi:hypothetical protein
MMSDIQRYYASGRVVGDGYGPYVEHADHVEALRQAEERVPYPEWDNNEYEQGQRDEREKWEPMVQALTDELLAKPPEMSMGAQYLAGVAMGQRDALAAVTERLVTFHRGSCRRYYVENRCTCGLEDAIKGDQ